MKIRKEQKVFSLLIFIVCLINNTSFAQIPIDFFSQKLLDKQNVKEVIYQDTNTIIKDSFDTNGFKLITRVNDLSGKLVVLKVYAYERNQLSKILYYKTFPEFLFLKETGDDIYTYDTTKQSRLVSIIGHDWGRYTANKIITHYAQFNYQSDSIPSQMKQLRKWTDANYVYDSQDTNIIIYALNYDNAILNQLQIFNRTEENKLQEIYFSYANKEKRYTSSVNYKENGHSPEFEQNYSFDLKGLLQKSTNSFHNNTFPLADIYYEYHFY